MQDHETRDPDEVAISDVAKLTKSCPPRDSRTPRIQLIETIERLRENTGAQTPQDYSLKTITQKT
jgi:hypothetical protein